MNLIFEKFEKALTFLARFFFPLATVWYGLEPSLAFLGDEGFKEIPYEWKLMFWRGALLLGAVWAIGKLYYDWKEGLPANEISIKVGKEDVIIKFGDLFDATEHLKVVAVSQYLYETNVFKKSIQRKLIEKTKIKEEKKTAIPYSEQITNALGDTKHNVDTERQRRLYEPILKMLKAETETETETELAEKMAEESSRQFPLGTTIHIKGDNEQGQEQEQGGYLLFALTQTECSLEGSNEIPTENNCSIPILWETLANFWESANPILLDKGCSIAIPLIGHHVNGVKLSPYKILELNLLAILYASEANKLLIRSPNRIEIILHKPSVGNEIDLKQVAQAWKDIK